LELIYLEKYDVDKKNSQDKKKEDLE